MNILIYLAQVSACTGIFCIFYYCFLRRLTFFTINRWYLLATLFVSFVIPLITIPVSVPAGNIVVAQPVTYINAMQKPLPQVMHVVYNSLPAKQSINWLHLIQLGYLSSVTLLAIYLAATFAFLLMRLKRMPVTKVGDIKILKVGKQLSNSSFLNYIFINDDELNQAEIDQVIAHELLHVRLCHSADRIIAKIAQVILWFNPFAYLYIKLIEENHEFEVDSQIVQSANKSDYASLLLKLSTRNSGLLYSNFSKIPLKKRIIMLFHKPTSNMKKIIYLLTLPVLVVSCLAFSKLHIKRRLSAIGDLARFGQNVNSTPDTRQRDLDEYRKTEDFAQKSKSLDLIFGKTVQVKVIDRLKDAQGHERGFLIAYQNHNYVVDTRIGQNKQLRELLNVGTLATIKFFGGAFDKGSSEIKVGVGTLFKDDKVIFQLAETAPLPKAAFATLANRVNVVEGQVTGIEKYPNGKWKKATVEEVNGYKFVLDIKPTAPDFSGIESSDHVRLLFVNQGVARAKEYKISNWLSITNNNINYSVKNPDLFGKYYN